MSVANRNTVGRPTTNAPAGNGEGRENREDREDREGFAAPTVIRPNTAIVGVAAETQRAIAEIQAALTVAQARPRNEVAAIDRIRIACERPRLADVAEYVYNRGGESITGATIDLMTVIANCWGNIQFGFRELTQSPGESSVEAFAWDLESNSKRTVVFTVPHKRVTKRGTTTLTDPRDIYELMANNAQRRVRACLEAIIPPDVVEDARDQCAATLKVTAEVTEESIAKTVAAFESIKVNRDQLQKRLGRRLEAMQPAQLVTLRKIYKSIHDGMSNVPDWFEDLEATEAPPAPKTAADAAKAALQARGAAKPAAPKARPAVDPGEPAPAPAAQEDPFPPSRQPAKTAPARAPAKAGPTEAQFRDFLRDYEESALADFDLERLFTDCSGVQGWRGFIDSIISRSNSEHGEYLKPELEAEDASSEDDENIEHGEGVDNPENEPDLEEPELEEPAGDGEPDFITNPAPQPKRMDLVAANLAKKILGKRSPDEIRKFIASDVKGNPGLVEEEELYLTDLALRRAYQLENNIPTTDRLAK